MSRFSKLTRFLYTHLPAPSKQALVLLPYPLIAGRQYRRCLASCRQLDSASRPEVLALQKRLLSDLLHFAVHEVPFYERYKGIVARLEPLEALGAFPYISKTTVENHFEGLTAKSLKTISHRWVTTGGSSGQQLVFLEDDATYVREMGFMHAQWNRVGYTPRCRKATFRGVQFKAITNSCFWQYNPIHNELQFSPFHMNDGTLSLYVKQLIKYGPEFIHGYPSAVDTLAEYILRRDLMGQMPAIRAVLLGSEGCSPLQRRRIEAAFRTRVYTWYGHSERTVLGGECEYSQVYHMFPSYGILEIIGEDGEPCAVGAQGEIVGTGFLNRSMPLIRYRTDDYATRESQECDCGRCWDRFSHVVGRRSLEGFVLGKHGSRISEAALNVHDRCFDHVVRYQYYQRTPGQLVIRVIPNPLYSPADEAGIVAAYEKKLWGEMDIVVEKVADIPLTKSGKQRRLLLEIEGSAAETGPVSQRASPRHPAGAGQG